MPWEELTISQKSIHPVTMGIFHPVCSLVVIKNLTGRPHLSYLLTCLIKIILTDLNFYLTRLNFQFSERHVTGPGVSAFKLLSLSPVLQPNKQGDQNVEKAFAQVLEKVAKTVTEPKKCQNIYNNAQFEIPKHLEQTAFEIPLTNITFKWLT
jgi:hypothetical protein